MTTNSHCAQARTTYPSSKRLLWTLATSNSHSKTSSQVRQFPTRRIWHWSEAVRAWTVREGGCPVQFWEDTRSHRHLRGCHTLHPSGLSDKDVLTHLYRNLPYRFKQSLGSRRRQPKRTRRRAKGSRNQQISRCGAEEGMLLDRTINHTSDDDLLYLCLYMGFSNELFLGP